MRLIVKTLICLLFTCYLTTASGQNAQSYIEKGDNAYNAGRMDDAISFYTNAIRADNSNATAYAARGNAFVAKNDLASAIMDFNKALELDPEHDEALSGRGNYYRLTGMPDNAINDYTAAIRIDPKISSYYTGRGIVYMMKQSYDLALQDFNTAISTEPKNADGYYQRGSVLNILQRFDEATRDLNEAIRLAPNFAEAYAQRGQSFLMKGNNDAALKDYNKTIGLGNETADVYYARGFCYAAKLKHEDAIKDYFKALELNPNFEAALAARGYSFNALQFYDDAIADYTSAIQLNSNNAGYFANRAFSYSMKSEYDSAIMDINIAIVKNPGDPGNYNNRALYYNNIGKYELSVKDFRICLSKNAQFASAYINIISPLVRLNRLQDAKTYYDLYRQKHLASFLELPAYKFYQDFLTALDQTLNNKPQEALASLDKANEEYGNVIQEQTKRAYIDMMYLYASILEQQGQDDDALSFYQQSLTIDARQPDVETAIARINKKQEKASDADKTAPEISLINPAQGETVSISSGKTRIIGRASDPAGIASVMINKVKVDRVEGDGLFVTEISLAPGNNTIEISASDTKGNTATQPFTVKGVAATEETRGGEVKNNAEIAKTAQSAGTYYAIFIANQDYNETDWKKLANPVSDAVNFRNLLVSKYMFEPQNTDTLFNKNRSEMLIAISKTIRKMGKNDNLLIFYAGHGKSVKNDDGTIDGYLIPTDGTGDMPTWVSTNDLKSVLKTPAGSAGAKHVLFVADACFSGALTRGGQNTASPGLQRLIEKKSRTAMTSGNLEEVPDISMFLKYLMQSLENNTSKFLTASDLFSDFKDAVINNTKNIPLCRAIQDVGDEGGEFVFIKR